MSGQDSEAAQATGRVRLMTWNVLFHAASSPLGGWPVRGPIVRAVIEAEAPDIICLQEILEGELEFARSGVNGYGAITGPGTGTPSLPSHVRKLALVAALVWAVLLWGTGLPPWNALLTLAHVGLFGLAVLAPLAVTLLEHYRGPYLGPGEFMPILYRIDRVRPVASGPAWLSNTPDVPGSMLPQMTEPRMLHWARFEPLTGGDAFLVVNAHLGHAPWLYAGAARVVLATIAAQAPDPRTVVYLAGDFNAVPGSGVIRRLVEPRGPLRLAWSEAERREGPVATFQWNETPRMPRLTLDHVLFRGPVRPVAARVLTPRSGGLPPSDHDPIVVDFET